MAEMNEVLVMIYVREPTYQTCSGACADDIHQLVVELDFSKQNGYQDVTEEKIETILQSGHHRELMLETWCSV